MGQQADRDAANEYAAESRASLVALRKPSMRGDVYENTLHEEQIEQAKNIAVDEINYISADQARKSSGPWGENFYETRGGSLTGGNTIAAADKHSYEQVHCYELPERPNETYTE
eukprot:UC4_evm1s1439